MAIWLIGVIVFVFLLAVLFLGLPVAFSCGGLAILLCLWVYGIPGLYAIATTTYAEMTVFVFIAVPLFIFMAEVLSFSNIASELFDIVYHWMGSFRGGLAIGTVVICAVFAAMVGVSTAAAATMALVALPPMLERGYNKGISSGAVAAGGALGILIPPSIIMIILGQIAELSIGQLFSAAMIPGIMLTIIFCLYIGIRCFFDPKSAPALPKKYRVSWRKKFRMLIALLPPIILVFLVLGSIYSGFTTPTEAAAVGAAGSVIIAIAMRRFNLSKLSAALHRTLTLTSMILWITIGAVSFTHMVAVLGVSDWLRDIVVGLEINRWVIMAAMQALFFIMGCFLDPVGIILITAPICMPVVISLGFDPIWFGVLFTINMEMAYITPPFGFNLFVLRGSAPPEFTLSDIYKGIWPYVGCQAFCIMLLMLFPDIVLWLPRLMIN